MTLKSQIDRFSQNEENFNAIITGSAGTTVDLGDAGIVKSVATVIGEIAPGVDRGSWATTTAYIINDIVLENGAYYRCRENHTSGTFATDLAAGKWRLNQGGDSTILTHRGRALDDAFTARFETVTAMIADVNLEIGDRVVTYANQNGAAVKQEWEIVAAATGTPDGGSYIDLTGSGLQAKQEFNGTEIDLKLFGAKYNDASFDNAPVFNACFIYCNNGAIRPTGAGTYIGQRYKLVISSDGSTGSYLNFTTPCLLTQQWYDIEFRDYVLIKQHATFPANTPLFGGKGHVASFGGKGVVDPSVWRILDVDNQNADMGIFEYYGLLHKANIKSFRFNGYSSHVDIHHVQHDACLEAFDISCDSAHYHDSWLTEGLLTQDHDAHIKCNVGHQGAVFDNIVHVPITQTANYVATINAGRLRSNGTMYVAGDPDIPTGYNGSDSYIGCGSLQLNNWRQGAEPGSHCCINWASKANTSNLDLGQKLSIIDSNISSVRPLGSSTAVRFYDMPNILTYRRNTGLKDTTTVFTKSPTATFSYTIAQIKSYFNYDVRHLGESSAASLIDSSIRKFFYPDIYEMTGDNGSNIGYCDLTQYSSIPTAGAFEVTFAARANNVVGEYRTCAKYWVHWAVGYNGSSVVAKIETVQAFKSTLTISSSLSLSAVFVDQATQTVENTEISSPSALTTNYIRLKISGFSSGGPNQQVRLRIRDEFGSQELITKYVTNY